MNINDVSKREVLEFDEFKKRVHDEQFKPLNPENQKDSSEKTGLHKIKRMPQFDFVGYADAIFNEEGHIDVPGYQDKGNREYSVANASPSIINQPNSGRNIGVSENESYESEEGSSFIIDYDSFDPNDYVPKEENEEKE